jgi:hypothetical protein
MIDREAFTTAGRFLVLLFGLKLTIFCIILSFAAALSSMSGQFETLERGDFLAIAFVIAGCYGTYLLPRLIPKTVAAFFAFSDAWWTSFHRHTGL